MTRLRASLLIVLMTAACDGDSAASAKTDAVTPEPPPKPAAPAAPSERPGQLGDIAATEVIDLRALVNKSIEQVEAILGEPTDKGTDRISCVRFVPDRVFFACEQEIRVYAHAAFESVRVEFEDKKAAHVSIIGVPGEGEFDPRAAMASLGITVPGEPRTKTETVAPVDGSEGGTAYIWDWGNSASRLIIDGLQHRVRVSVVDGDWRKAKVEIINNHPLDADQSARIKPVKGQAESTEAVSE